jgi:hypothetical protein
LTLIEISANYKGTKMFFKLTAKNAYRDLVRNARRIVIADMSDSEKSEAFKELYKMLQPKLYENEQSLNSQAAFAQRCEHWNKLDISSIRPVKNMKNPWLSFKREFESMLQAMDNSSYSENVRSVSRSLSWFYTNDHRDDWIVD